MPYKANKTLYIFLSSLLGLMLFLTLHRIIIFLLLIFSGASGNLYFGLTYLEFLAVDYLSLIIILLFGAWYGIWIGSYWYEKIYTEGMYSSAASLFFSHYKSKQISQLRQKVSKAAIHLENDLWALEDLVNADSLVAHAEPKTAIKRKVVRKKAPKKIN